MPDEHAFGHWLRERRKACDLTQEALGERVGCAAETIRRFEAGRLRPSREVAARLATQLRLVGTEAEHFVEAARKMGHAVTPSPKATQQTLHSRPLLAPRKPLIGRDQDEATACGLLQREDVRLLTLLGTGGIGKTQLGIRVAETLSSEFDVVWYVPLAAIRTPELVGPTIAQVVGAKEGVDEPVLEVLARAFGVSRTLLLLDNFEHVVAAAPLVVDLLARVPNLKILVTSRAALAVSGEQQLPVPPLAVPAAPNPTSAAVAASPAAALFIERARAVHPGFELSEENAQSIAHICARLDGLPLAIELAAARSPLFAPSALLARLTNRLAFLTWGVRDAPTRHQTLRHTLDWSYELLDVHEQQLFRRLSVFEGGFTLAAAEAVCGSGDGVTLVMLDGIQSLYQKTLLVHHQAQDGEPWFSMLETVQEYAREKCLQAAEAEAVRQRHATYFLTFAEGAERHLIGPEQATWLDNLEREHNNLRAAIQWSQTYGDARIALRIVSAIAWFWYIRGYWREGREQHAAALAVASEPTLERAKALNTSGWLATFLYDDMAALALHREALAICRAQGDRYGVARALRGLGDIGLNKCDYQEAQAFHEQALTIFRSLDVPFEVAGALNGLGEGARASGDYLRAATLYAETLEAFRGVGGPRGIAIASLNLGFVAMHQRDTARAAALFREGLAHSTQIGEDVGATTACIGLASIALVNEAPVEAVRLVSAADALLDRIHGQLDPPDKTERDGVLLAARARLDEATFRAAWEYGQTMTLNQAAELMWNLDADPAPQDGRRTRTVQSASDQLLAALTPRELEVLRLVAEGLSDAAIAERLVISPRTVNAHLTSVFRKLNVTNRTAAARFAADYPPF